MDLRTALECECCSTRVDLLHDVVAYSDEAVAKALMVSEVAQIARLERRMREFLLGKWRARVQEASRAAGARIAGGGSLAQAYKLVDKSMGKWAGETAPRFGDDAGKAYRLARKAGAKKAQGKTKASLSYQTPNFTDELPERVVKAVGDATTAASFTLIDQAAIADLGTDSALWIGRHYDENVRATVRTAVTPATIQGLSSRKAGEAVRDAVGKSLKKVTVPKGFNGSDIKYFEGLAANTVTNARVRGQIRSFQEFEVIKYEVVNPNDSRTSRICQHMNGKIFLVQQAVTQIERVSGITDPDKIKKLHPWMSMDKLLGISPKAGHVSDKDSKALADVGLSLPTYHFRCRSTVDVSFS